MVRNFVQRLNALCKKNSVRFAVVILGVCLCFALVGSVGQPVFANDGTVETTFFGDFKDEGNGCGVYMVLNYAIDVMAFGVGIAAIVGIVISGITYMTAKDNQERTLKAKRRIYEIVIGLMVYLALWSLLSFLLPGGVLNNSPKCGDATGTGSFFTEPNETTAPDARKDRWNHYGYSRRYATSSGGSSLSSEMTSGSGDILTSAKKVAEIYVKNRFTYSMSNNVTKITVAWTKKNGRSNCATYVSLVAQAAGLIKNGEIFYTQPSSIHNSKVLNKNFKVTKVNGATLGSLVKNKKLVPGDFVGMYKHTHTMIYAGRKDGKYIFYNGGRNATNTGGVGGRYTNTNDFIDNYGSCGSGKCQVSWVIHPKGP